MKRIALSSIILLLGFGLISQAQTNVKNQAMAKSKTVAEKIEWKTVEEDTYQISYPSSWDYDTSGTLGSKFFLFSPLTSEQDAFRENVNFMIQDLTGLNIDLEKYVAVTLDQVRTLITDGKVISNEAKEADGTTFQKLIYSGKQGVYDLMFEQYCWVKDDEAYILTFTAEKASYESSQETAEKILNSFNLSRL